jgi:hypothetical protein
MVASKPDQTKKWRIDQKVVPFTNFSRDEVCLTTSANLYGTSRKLEDTEEKNEPKLKSSNKFQFRFSWNVKTNRNELFRKLHM